MRDRITIIEAIKLEKKYGSDFTLGELRRIIQGDYKFECPCCHGLGYTIEKYNAYPTNLPDSGFVEDWKCREVTCNICNGIGYTKKEYVPVTRVVIDGYEEKK